MASLFNTKISATYPSLIKTLDTTAVTTATLKLLSDGNGTSLGLSVNNQGDFKVNAILEWGSLKDTGTGITITNLVNSTATLASNKNDTTIPTSKAVSDYVDGQVTLVDLDFLGDSNTGTPAVDLDSQSFRVLGTTNQITTSGENQTLTLSLPSTVHRNLQGNVTGNLTGNVTGNVTGDLTGDSAGTHTGAVVGNVTGNLTGNVTGNLTGTINSASVLANGVTATSQAVADDSTKVATTAFVQDAIGTIPAGLVFQGTWNATTNSPSLSSGTGTTGHFYIVSVAGSTDLDGITDWKVGDWAVFVEQGASDQWEKVDNSSVLDGNGTGGKITKWAGSGNSVTLTDSVMTELSSKIGIGTANPTTTLDVNGNATFSGDVTIDNGTTSILIIEKDATGGGKVQFNNAGSQEAYISLDAAEDMTFYAAANNDQLFYAGGALNETKSGTSSTFAGTVTGGNGTFTNLTINAGEKLRFDGAGGHTFIQEVSNDNLIFATGGTTRLTLDTNATFAGAPTGNNTIFIAGSRGAADNLPAGNITFRNVSNGVGDVDLTKIQSLTGTGSNQTQKGQLTFSTNNGTSLTERMRIDSAGAIKFNTYGAGTLVSDASGNITSISGGGQGGPYLPLAGGTLTGGLTINHSSGESLLLTKSTTEPSVRFEGDTNKDFVLTVSGETFTITQNDGATDILILDHDTKNATFGGDVGLGGTGLYTASHSLNIDGTGLAIKNDTNGSSNNWSTIKNTDTGSNSNLVFNSGLGTALTLNHDKSATFAGNVGIGSFPTSRLQIEQSILPRITMIKTGVLSWYVGNPTQGSSGNFTIGTDSGSNLDILTLDTSANATFAGDVTIGSTGAGSDKTLNILTGGTKSSVKLMEAGNVYGFSTVYDGAANKFHINRHNNSAAGTPVLSFNRDDDNATFAGNVFIPDNKYATFGGANNAWELQIGVVGDNAFIEKTATSNGDLYIKNNGSGKGIIFQNGGATALTIDSSQNATFAGNVTLNSRLTFDYGGDHYLEAGTNSLSYKSSSGSSIMSLNASTSAATFGGDITVADRLLINATSAGSPYVSFDQAGTEKAYIQYADSGDNFILQSDNIISFKTGGATERMRINSSGFIYVNTGGAEPSASQVGVRITGTQGQSFWNSANSGTSGYNHFNFYNGNGIVGSIVTNGSATAFNTSSDYRLKENVVEMTGALDRVAQLKPSRFNFIADSDKVVDGFLAHEVQSVVPEAITGTKDAVDEEGNPDYQGIDQSKLVPLLVGAIQELQARIKVLESK